MRGENSASPGGRSDVARPTAAQRRYLERGLEQPGGKLPLFDRDGREFDARTIRACIRAGWAEPWFANRMKPDWLICRLTEAGRQVLESADA
ncbi:MAG TPA: hypothetical protein VE631_03595 [Alphaproteobacteria bacterium]|nr:hypothetical protein [Alphaproteobacteria bacterium]